MERRAPMGEPTIYEVRNALLAIRRHDAERVQVAAQPNAPAGGDDVAL